MKKIAFKNLKIGEIIYNPRTYQVRDVVAQFKDPYNVDNEASLFTRNSLLRGYEGYNQDRLDVPLLSHPDWKIFDNIYSVKSSLIREKMLMYEVKKLKLIIYNPGMEVFPGMFSDFL